MKKLYRTYMFMFGKTNSFVVFRTPTWETQMQDIVNYRSLASEEGEDDPRSISIPELEGECVVEGHPLREVDVTKPLKLSEVNIGRKEHPKLAKIGDYWDENTVGKVAELFTEYQDLFPTKFFELKGITGDLGVMHITLKPDARPIKQRPYRLNPKYKHKVKEDRKSVV